MRQVILTPDEDGIGYTVEVPSLSGCVSEGDTLQEALNNIQEAIALYIEVLEEDHKQVPEDFECLQFAFGRGDGHDETLSTGWPVGTPRIVLVGQ